MRVVNWAGIDKDLLVELGQNITSLKSGFLGWAAAAYPSDGQPRAGRKTLGCGSCGGGWTTVLSKTVPEGISRRRRRLGQHDSEIGHFLFRRGSGGASTRFEFLDKLFGELDRIAGIQVERAGFLLPIGFDDDGDRPFAVVHEGAYRGRGTAGSVAMTGDSLRG